MMQEQLPVLEKKQWTPPEVIFKKNALFYNKHLHEIDDSVLIRYIKERVAHDRNFILLVVGDTGSGKSSVALRIMELLDPNPSVDNVIFTINEFARVSYQEDRPKGSVIVFDEAGIEMDNYKWYTDKNITMAQMLMTSRYKNHIYIFTVPVGKFIALKSRILMHGVVLCHGNIDYKDGVNQCKFYLQKVDWKTGETQDRKLRLFCKDGSMKMKGIGFRKPSTILYNEYERRANAFKERVSRVMLMENFKVSEIDPERAEQLRAVGGREEMNLMEHNVYIRLFREMTIHQVAKDLEITMSQVRAYRKKILDKGYDIPRSPRKKPAFVGRDEEGDGFPDAMLSSVGVS